MFDEDFQLPLNNYINSLDVLKINTKAAFKNKKHSDSVFEENS